MLDNKKRKKISWFQAFFFKYIYIHKQDISLYAVTLFEFQKKLNFLKRFKPGFVFIGKTRYYF